MKKLLIGIVILGSLVSCSLETYSLPEVPMFNSMEEAFSWVHFTIRGRPDMETYGYSDYWASPDETLINGQGDCEDFAILFAYICYVQFGIKVQFSFQHIISKPETHHMSVYYNEKYWDAATAVCALDTPVHIFEEECKFSYAFIMSCIGHKA